MGLRHDTGAQGEAVAVFVSACAFRTTRRRIKEEGGRRLPLSLPYVNSGQRLPLLHD